MRHSPRRAQKSSSTPHRPLSLTKRSLRSLTSQHPQSQLRALQVCTVLLILIAMMYAHGDASAQESSSSNESGEERAETCEIPHGYVLITREEDIQATIDALAVNRMVKQKKEDEKRFRLLEQDLEIKTLEVSNRDFTLAMQRQALFESDQEIAELKRRPEWSTVIFATAVGSAATACGMATWQKTDKSKVACGISAGVLAVAATFKFHW